MLALEQMDAGDHKLNMKKSLLSTQLLIVSASVITVSVLLIFSTVIASPTLPPPDGNPIIPGQPQGPQGNQGQQGYRGSQGPQGSTGATGAAGYEGVPCNFPGYGLYFSHGYDGGCAWSSGISMSCNTSGRVGNFNRWSGCGFAK